MNAFQSFAAWATNNVRILVRGLLVIAALVAIAVVFWISAKSSTDTGSSISFRWEAGEKLALQVSQVGSVPISGLVAFSSTSSVYYDAWRTDTVAPPIFGEPVGDPSLGPVTYVIPQVNIPAATSYVMNSGWAQVTLLGDMVTATRTPIGDHIYAPRRAFMFLILAVLLILMVFTMWIPKSTQRRIQRPYLMGGVYQGKTTTRPVRPQADHETPLSHKGFGVKTARPPEVPAPIVITHDGRDPTTQILPQFEN